MERPPTMTEYVIESRNECVELSNTYARIGDDHYLVHHSERCFTYAQLLQRPLSLDMFIPCKDGEPMVKMNCAPTFTPYPKHLREFKEAEDRVLIANCELHTPSLKINGKTYIYRASGGKISIDIGESTCYTIEDLINSGIELTPTESCKKIIGL
jgi:hypothetical protein